MPNADPKCPLCAGLGYLIITDEALASSDEPGAEIVGGFYPVEPTLSDCHCKEGLNG